MMMMKIIKIVSRDNEEIYVENKNNNESDMNEDDEDDDDDGDGDDDDDTNDYQVIDKIVTWI